MTKRHTSTTELARDFGLAAGHAAITLWYRWPMLAAPRNIRGESAHDAEFGRMVAEKGAATVEGLFEAQKVILKLAGAAMRGQINPATIPAAIAAVAVAGLRPAFRTVKANSRRLGRRA
jgi:hypothetical protein